MASRGSSHRLRALLIVLVVLVGLAVAADRIGVYVAERIAGQQLQKSQHLPGRPDVDVHGFPFLTQLASGKYDLVTADADTVPLGSGTRELDLDHLQVTLHHVTITNTFHDYAVRDATADAHASYAALSRPVGIDLAYAGGGRVKASKSVTVLGHTLTASITAQPAIVKGALAFTKTSVDGLDGVAQSVLDGVSQVFAVKLPLDGVPFDVRATGLTADASGLTLTLAGENLTYSS
jgi:hypothetical protein